MIEVGVSIEKSCIECFGSFWVSRKECEMVGTIEKQNLFRP
jgi:hypothetical protein